ncbi:Virginiamycin B lyase [Zhongshania aliphaticivorans]|uniref:Virginiamycin B lyase n=1 Tax=Zhongshania aliphaticivorans TaxID=1470434 RepID=A0A5S9MW70_9GAMM|nr:cytochrome C [Zhongshania aliphaticivorans]CAA0080475.1 Virginiamycin B lyase [Zhongshania aliphaticivorans]CAA0085715.1 Virginiamycin B lyase [Zhongshania aliphaticivorans]
MARLGISRTAALALCLFSTSSTLSAAALPEGQGKEMVQALCSSCHTVSRISESMGYSKNGWQALFSTMIDLSANTEQQDIIASYLASHFPPNQRRVPKLVTGETQIRFKEWQTPTLGQRSRDPVESPDGAIWWAGQWGNLIGRLDPASGDMREYPLPASAMPHSVTPDQHGNIWYTGNKNASVGKLNPSTGKITVYDMPDPAARDPHTAVFDSKGILWFTLQHANRIGRLDPSSGEIKLVNMPRKNSRPYGIKIDGAGTPWVACNGNNCLVSVNPKTMALTEIKLPHQDTTVRRLDIAADGMIWYVNSGRGRLGRYNPESGEIQEWPSPSGPRSHPYAIAVVNGIVWYNESGKRPDALVRFDPKTEAFQSWAIPSGDVYAGIVRHMRPTRSGDLLIHQSATNHIIRVDIDD